MLIQKLKLYQYRNYEALDLRPAPGVNVISGRNAQGKTNAAEAIFLCAFGRSHLTARDAELIRRGCAGGYVGLSLQSGTGAHEIELKLAEGEKKKIYIDRQLAKRTGELMGVLNVVMFSPEDLALVKEGPAERRRFMDMELSQIKPAYYYRLQQYNAALRQRNALLKSDERIPPAMLETWDEQLASLGAQIIRDRAEFLSTLSGIARALHDKISGGAEQLEVFYQPSVDAENPDGIFDALMECLIRTAQEDIRRGFTSVGPHRDDICIRFASDGGKAELPGMEPGPVDVRVFGSQGQKRTAALSLKLSEVELLKRLKGEPPVLILDDVLSELDEKRQRMLIAAAEGCQCFLTCTDPGIAARAGLDANAISHFVCENGKIREE